MPILDNQLKIVDNGDMQFLGTAEKITEWANEPSPTKLKEDLEASKSSHDSFMTKVNHWNDLIKVQGVAKIQKVKGRSQVQPKLIRRQAEWRYSALTEPFLSSEKMFTVSPTSFEDKSGAEQNELVLNWQIRTKVNRVRFIDSYVRTAVDEGTVIVRVGWNRITVKEKEQVPVWAYTQPESEEDIQALDIARTLKQENPREYEETVKPEMKAAVDYMDENGVPTVVIQSGTQEIEIDKVIDNRPTLDILNPENVYIDPSCGDDLCKASFVIISFETSQAELLKQPERYKNLKHVNWENATIVVANDHATKTPQDFNFKDELRKRVVAYEYWGLWDIENNKKLVPIVATWIGDVMVRLELNPFPDGKPPFVLANYMPIKRELMGEPDAELLEDNQNILGAISRGMIDLMGRSANSQQGIAKGMLDVVNRRRFESGSDYEYNPNINPDIGLKEHKYPEIPQSAMSMIMMQNGEAEALTGVKAFGGGLSGEAYGEVAAGIRGVLDAASKREMAILRRLAMGMAEIGQKIISMNQEFLSEEETVRVTNEKYVTVKREDIQGQYDLEVDISTAEIDNNKAQDLAFLLQTIGNNMDFGITQMILAEIARLKRMPVLAHSISKFQPKPDPLLVEKQQLENEKLKLEVEKLRTEAKLNEAKTEKTMVEADALDLDKTEQETGTTHERDLEKQRAQSQGNQQLEVTKSLLKSRKPDETKPDVDAAIGYNSISNEIGKTERPKETPLDPLLNSNVPIPA